MRYVFLLAIVFFLINVMVMANPYLDSDLLVGKFTLYTTPTFVSYAHHCTPLNEVYALVMIAIEFPYVCFGIKFCNKLTFSLEKH